jgi:hypothetical protein
VPKLNHTQKYQKDTQSVISNTQSYKGNVVFTLKQTLLSVEMTLSEGLFLCRSKQTNKLHRFYEELAFILPLADYYSGTVFKMAC